MRVSSSDEVRGAEQEEDKAVRTLVPELVQDDAALLDPRAQEAAHVERGGVVEQVEALDANEAVPGEPLGQELLLVGGYGAHGDMGGREPSREAGEGGDGGDEGEGRLL